MYSSSEVADKINLLLKEKNKFQKTMLEDCGLNKNTISTMLSRGSMPKADNLAKIADYLDVSVDYLLGRTDEQTATYYTNNVNGINFSNLIQGSSAVTVNSNNNDYKGLSNEETEILDIYRSLDIRNKNKFLNIILDMEKEESN